METVPVEFKQAMCTYTRHTSLDLKIKFKASYGRNLHDGSARTRALRKSSSQAASPTEQIIIVQRRESALMNVVPSFSKTSYLSVSIHRKIVHPLRIISFVHKHTQHAI